MNVKNVAIENNRAKIEVEVDKEAFEAALQNAYLKNRKSIALPGFRKGKAPRKMIESIFGKEVFYEDAVNDLFPKVYEELLADQKLNAVGMPSVTDMNVDENGALTLKVETDLYPEVTLGDYKGLEIPKAEAVVTEADVDAEVDRMARNVARVESVETEAVLGDVAVIDFEGFKDGVAFDGGKAEGHELELGSGAFIPGFEDQVVGMKAGEEKEINVTFPEDYQEASLAGAPVVFKVKVHEVKRTTLPELDDEFVKDVSEFDTMEQLRADLKEKALKEKQAGIDRAFENAAIEQAVKNMKVDVPASMVEEQLDRNMENFAYDLRAQGATVEQYAQMLGVDVNTLRGYLRPGAEKDLRTNLLLTAVVAAENIEVTDEEIEAEYAAVAATYSMDVEKVKEALKAETIADELKNRKAGHVIVDSAVAVAPEAKEAASEE